MTTPLAVRSAAAALIVLSAVSAPTALATTASAARAADPGVTLLGAWTADERGAIARVLERIPDQVRAVAPRRFVRDARACGADGWPDDDRRLIDAGGVVHVCATLQGAAPGADTTARRLVVALLLGFDRAARWSDEPGWRGLNRWRPSLLHGLAARSDNLDPRGFADERGQRSPRWDLATFLASLWLDAPAGGDRIDCRLISQARFVRAHLDTPAPAARCADFEDWADLPHLGAIEVVLAAPSTAMLGSLFGHVFLRLDYRDGTADENEDAAIAAPHRSRTVAFLADNDVPFTEDPAYAVKGIFGEYAASLHERSYLEAYRDYVVVEGRDLRRWRLGLDAGERRALLERIWTVAHGSRYAYYFFRRNCATLLVDLIDDVRARPSADGAPGLLATPPATTLEPWAHAAASDSGGDPLMGPLLSFVADPIWSFDHQARAAAERRRALEAVITVGLDAASAAIAARALHDTHAADEPGRARGYEQLALLLAHAGAARADDLRDWLCASATIEMRLSTAANIEAEVRAEWLRRQRVGEAATRAQVELARAAAALQRIGPAAGAAPAELGARLQAAIAQVAALDPAARLQGYRALRDLVAEPALPRDLADGARRLALLQSERRYDVLRMKGVPGLRDALLFADADQPIDAQPYLAGQGNLLRLPVETRISPALRALQRARQSLFAARALQVPPPPADPDAKDAPSAPASDTTLGARRDYEASLPHSGIDRMAALAALSLGAGHARPGLIVAGALYDEQLGDHHRFGFPSDTALVVARSALFLSIVAGRPAIAAYDGRLFGYRSLRTSLPESGGGRWPLGWEVWGDLEGDRGRGLAAGATLGWGALARLWDRGDLGDHLIGGGAIAYHAAFSERAGGACHLVGIPLALEWRTGLGAAPAYRSSINARAWVEPAGATTGDALRFAAIYGARVEANLALRRGPRPTTEAHDPALVVRAQVTRTPLTFTAETATQALLSLGLDLR